MRNKLYFYLVKPILDLLISLIAFILFSPFFIIITIFLYFVNQGKPFFIQKRPGKNCKVFKIIKFKTMSDKKDKNGNLLPDAERLTTIGKWVRKTSLDEIPQLINVIKGDMSLIGPRPLLTDYVHLYSNFQNRRHEVKPGITGWAQVNGRNAISWDKKFELDVYYVDHLSLKLDIKIVFNTFKKVLVSEGINAENSATIEPFYVEKLVSIYGAGGHSKVVIDAILSSKKHRVKNIFDDNKEGAWHDYNIIDSKFLLEEDQIVIAIGDNHTRKNIVQKLSNKFATIIHKSAVVSSFATIGEGSQILPKVIINPDAKIGKHCIINTNSIVEHDCKIGDFVHVSPNATLGGGVSVGDLTHIGMGATILQGVKIGKNVVVGAGAVVTNDIDDNFIVVGVPAKFIKFNNE